MHDSAVQTLLDYRGEDLAGLVLETRRGKNTALDRILTLSNTSNLFNNCISTNNENPIG